MVAGCQAIRWEWLSVSPECLIYRRKTPSDFEKSNVRSTSVLNGTAAVAMRRRPTSWASNKENARYSWRRPSTGNMRAAQALGAMVAMVQMSTATTAVMTNSLPSTTTGKWSMR